VAKVETKLSVLNGLVSIVTMSIYSPVAIRVMCAEGPGAAGQSAAVIIWLASLHRRRRSRLPVLPLIEPDPMSRCPCWTIFFALHIL